MKRYVALAAAVIMMSLTACGTFASPQVTETTATTTMTETTTVPLVTTVPEDSSESEVTTKVTMSEEEKKQLAANTFIAEFYDSPISFDDMSKTVSEVMKKSGFENTVKSTNGVQKITVKGDNGSGVIDVMTIDISACDFSYDQEYIAEAFGAYCYGQTVGSMQGVTEDNFVSNCRMINTVVAKAKYHNAVFVGLDENGVPCQASKRSTTTMGKTVKLTVEGSDTKYSFAHYGTSGRLYVFEAPIDMLSYISLRPDNWQEHSYIAMNGVYESAVLYAMDTHSNIEHVVLCTDNDEGGIDGAERIRDILNERKFTNITRLYPTNKDWNEDLKARNGQTAIIAEPHRRKALYYSYVSQLRYYPCRTDRLSEQIRTAYKNNQLKYLAEYALAGSAFFMRVKDEPQGFQVLQKKLAKTYRAYSDKSRMVAKARTFSEKYSEVMRDLWQTARTEEQSIATAKKLYELADCAIRVSVEESYQQQNEQQTEDESEDEDISLSPQSGFS